MASIPGAASLARTPNAAEPTGPLRGRPVFSRRRFFGS